MKYENSKRTHIEEEKETQPIPGDDYLVINLHMTKCGENTAALYLMDKELGGRK